MQPILFTCLMFVSMPQNNTVQHNIDEPTPDYVQQIELWRSQRLEHLKAPTGWLAVSGLVWLKDGDFSFGSDPGHPISISQTSGPTTAGTIHVRGSDVTFEAAVGVELQLNGKPATSGSLRIDNTKPETNSPDQLKIGHTTLHLMRRSNRLAIRLRDSRHLLIEQFPGEQWYPVDEAFKVTARFTPYETTRSIEITNVKGFTHQGELLGFVEFEIQGHPIKLDVQAESKDEIFINFRDQTSGNETYAAGRMLNAGNPVNGSVELDFNKAYNPPCAYNTFTTCPLPPGQNHLNIAITAGAKMPSK